MNAGPRSGQLCQQSLVDRVKNHTLGVRFNWMLVDYAYCNPFRTAFLSGKTRPNNGCENDTASYYNQWRRGLLDLRVGQSFREWQGPFLQDLAMQYAVQHSETYDQ